MNRHDELISDIAWKELEIKKLNEQLVEAKDGIRRIGEARTNLANEVAESRAANQGTANGFLGGFLGAQYRAAARRSASASNAEVAKYAARRRIQLTNLKLQIQETERQIKAAISRAKTELKNLQKSANQIENSELDAISLLKKLKEVHELGLLTDEEYEQKRKALVQKI